jgi:hypothetical protein
VALPSRFFLPAPSKISAAQLLIYISRSVSRPDLIFAIGPNRARLLFARGPNLISASQLNGAAVNNRRADLRIYMRLGAKFYRRSDWN